MSNQTKQMILSLLPKGSAWEAAIDEDLDKFTTGEALNWDNIKSFLASLGHLRDPLKTPVLDELEKEFGVTKNDALTEQERRNYLNALIFSNDDNGTPEDVQDRLQEAGLDVQIHSNDPAIDPNIILDELFKMVAGGGNAYAGREDAFASRVGGELIVNGKQFQQKPNYTVVAGGPSAYAGIPSFVAGVFDELILIEIEYKVPTNSTDWPLVFFIGGDVTRDGGGFITDIERVVLPVKLRNEFLQIILKYKPLYTWGVSVVDFV